MHPAFAADARPLGAAEGGAQVAHEPAGAPDYADLELPELTYSLLMKCLISFMSTLSLDRGSQVKTVRKRSLSWRSW
ncbi:hypothetical protein D3C78_1716480 [compost metagenome]